MRPGSTSAAAAASASSTAAAPFRAGVGRVCRASTVPSSAKRAAAIFVPPRSRPITAARVTAVPGPVPAEPLPVLRTLLIGPAAGRPAQPLRDEGDGLGGERELRESGGTVLDDTEQPERRLEGPERRRAAAHVLLRTGVDHGEQLDEPLLLPGGERPVTGARGLVQPDVTGGVHVADAGHDTVGPGQQRRVHGEFGTGQHAEVRHGAPGPAFAAAELHDQPAQTALVTAAVLETGQCAVLGQLPHQGRGELGVHRDRDVVGEQREVDGRAEPPEVSGGLLRMRTCVEGGGRHEGVRAELRGGPRVLGDPGRRRVDDPGQDRDPPRRRGDHGPQGGGAPGVGQIRDLAGRTEGEEAVHATVDEVVDEPCQGRRVDLPAVVERGADRRYDAVQRCGQGHGEGLQLVRDAGRSRAGHGSVAARSPKRETGPRRET